MKIRYFLSLMVAMLLGTMSTVVAQDIEEKVPVTLNGVWQMCFYRSSSPDIPGELKTSNSLKILSVDGRFCNLVMMPQGAIIIGYGTYKVESPEVYSETIEKNIHLPQLDGKKNELHFKLEDNGNLMYIKYFLAQDKDGNQVDSWCYEIWKRVEMPEEYPENIIR